MGSRAHYVIVDGNSSPRVFYSQWGGDDVELDLLAGPEAARRFMERQHPVDGWADEVDCDGAALLDHAQQLLLWFSPCHSGPAYRAAVLRVLARTWPGWRVEWAYDGLRTLLACLGQDPELVRTPRELPVAEDIRTPEKFMAAMPQMWLNPEVYPPGSTLPASLPMGPPPLAQADPGDDGPLTLITVRSQGQVRAYVSDDSASAVCEHGVQALEILSEWTPVTHCPHPPRCGVHLDADAAAAGVWTTRVLWGEPARSAKAWPGWHWEVWGEDHRQQLARAGDAVELPALDVGAGLLALQERFEEHQKGGTAVSGIAMLLGATDALTQAAREAGYTVQKLEDNSMLHTPVDLTPAEVQATREAITACR
jgi:hypothetical protein